MRIALCDDNTLQLQILEDTARACSLWSSEKLQIDSFLSGIDLLNSICPDNGYNYIFLDLDMPELSGFDVFSKLSERTDAPIIFVSTHIEWLPEAFALRPFGFLAKPYTQDTFDRTVKSVIEQMTEINFFKYTHNNIEKAIPCREIICVTSREHVLEIHLVKSPPVILYRRNLDDVDQQLSSFGFIRCNRSTLVNLRFCYDRDGNMAMMSVDTIPIEISRRNIAMFDRELLKYKMEDKSGY